MKSYNAWINLLVFNIICMIAAIGLVNFFIDPLQFFRKASYNPIFSDNQRLQNPGLAKNYDYDTIILGTSVTENFVPSYINKSLGCKTIKLSVSGSTLKEQRLIGDVALKTGKVTTVIWGLDFTSARGNPEGVRTNYGPFPYYLYGDDDNVLNDVKYVFNGSTTRYSLTMLVSVVLNRPTGNLEMLNNWGKEYTFSNSEVRKDYDKTLNSTNSLDVGTGFNYENFKSNFDLNVLQVIEKNPDVNFILFFPPYSMPFYYCFFTKDNRIIDDWIQCKLYLVDKLANKKNVQVFDFQDVYQISYNLDNYRDMMHYSKDINQYIIDEISQRGNAVIDRQHYFTRLREFKSNVASYSIDLDRVPKQ